MKSNKFLIASLLILIGTGAILVSCKKENGRVKRVRVEVGTSNEKGGDDDEDPIIQGKVKHHNLTPVYNATVETIRYPANVIVGTEYTDSLGEFEQQVDSATYFFRVTVPGVSTPYITNRVLIDKDTPITIYVD